MFELYTEKARRAIFFARYEASVQGSPCIEAEHLLLGLMREDRQLFATLLSSGSNVVSLAEELRSNLPQQTPISTTVDLPFGHTAKRSLAYATEEADQLKNREIGPGHLLLGLLREDSPASKFLVSRGVTLTSVREKITDLHTGTNKSAEVMADLKREFAGSLERLTLEIEPATIFSLGSSPEKGRS
jgi:ATP-dependent Clp protease ATP-binding subunit ClpC